MCGIFACYNSNISQESLKSCAERIKHRGPDNTQYLSINEKVFFGFHRLAINDMSSNGNQPLILDNKYFLVCNGEIYNHKSLENEYLFKTNSNSDCEVILHLYKLFGIHKTLELISGYFAFALYDIEKDSLMFARDPFGVRALYIANDQNESVCVCSELKGIPNEYVKVHQFPPGSYWQDGNFVQYYDYTFAPYNSQNLSLESELLEIRNLFTKAVEKRFMLERPFGVFLSGGLDSSLVAALVAKHNVQPIHSFSIGLDGSTDLQKARIVADHIGSIHHEVIVSPEQMLDAIRDVIYQGETWDTTTVRAMTPMYLLSKYIKENTDIVVVFSGEGSDEASGSYLYFHNAPNDHAFHQERIRLLKDLCYFDCLRCDKATAGNGLEVRVPFLDREFMDKYMRLPIEWMRPKDGMEKWFIRKAFDGTGLLPDEILWRKKEAFSDGVSSTEKSWFQIIQEYVDTQVSDTEYDKNRTTMKPEPALKESYYYRKIFREFYPGRDDTIPYYWLPKWSGDTKDPSARTLSIYHELDSNA